jgi:hypothetical protein
MARADYSKAERDGWQAARYAGEKARGVHSRGINNLPRAPNPFGPQGSLAKAADSAISQTVKAKTIALEKEMIGKAPKGSRIDATTPSTCLASLSWKADKGGDGQDGVATAEFHRGGAVVYDYNCDLDTFLEIAESDSIGKAANDLLFD